MTHETADGRENMYRPFFGADLVKSTSQVPNGSWKKTTSWLKPPPSQHDYVFIIWDRTNVLSVAERLKPVDHPSIDAFLSPCITFMSWTNTQFLQHWRGISAIESELSLSLSCHVEARAMVLPRLKTAYSELPPMAARWKRAHTAMMIIEEMDEKITTCAAAKWQTNPHICPNFTKIPPIDHEKRVRTNAVPACLAHTHTHTHTQTLTHTHTSAHIHRHVPWSYSHVKMTECKENMHMKYRKTCFNTRAWFDEIVYVSFQSIFCIFRLYSWLKIFTAKEIYIYKHKKK